MSAGKGKRMSDCPFCKERLVKEFVGNMNGGFMDRCFGCNTKWMRDKSGEVKLKRRKWVGKFGSQSWVPCPDGCMCVVEGFLDRDF